MPKMSGDSFTFTVRFNDIVFKWDVFKSLVCSTVVRSRDSAVFELEYMGFESRQ